MQEISPRLSSWKVAFIYCSWLFCPLAPVNHVFLHHNSSRKIWAIKTESERAYTIEDNSVFFFKKSSFVPNDPKKKPKSKAKKRSKTFLPWMTTDPRRKNPHPFSNTERRCVWWCITRAGDGFDDSWWKGKIDMRGKLYVGVCPSPYFETKTQKWKKKLW